MTYAQELHARQFKFMTFKLIRLVKDKNKIQKIGKLYVFDRFTELFSCFTLEPFESIAAGRYWLKKYMSPKLKRQVFLFESVPGHTFVEIHNGNYRRDTELCILVGEEVFDIDKDGLKDVDFSNITLSELLRLAPNEITIDIYEDPNEFNA